MHIQNINSIQDLLNLILVKEKGNKSFVGYNYITPWKRVYGGQVLAQALGASYLTTPKDRVAHSLHAYFILGGDVQVPIIYKVENIRDGGSFSTRRITALQNDIPIFHMSASFQKKQEGFNHQLPIPNVRLPEELVSYFEELQALKDSKPKLYQIYTSSLPKWIEYRAVEPMDFLKRENKEPKSNFWFRVKEQLNASFQQQQQILAYISDYGILRAAILPHRKSFTPNSLFSASLDHSIWFHRDFNLENWFLYSIESPSAGNSRGFATGNIYSKDGVLVASVAQEGLFRLKKEKKL